MTMLRWITSGLRPAPDRRSDTVDGPDFICIGMMKAATGWLYDQLQFHPDFWMPPFKEFHYFDKPFPSPSMLDLARRARADIEALNANRHAKLMRPLDGRDLDFLDRVVACEGAPVTADRYAALFAPKGPLLSGDITPAFSSLSAEAIEPLAERFVSTRILLMVRDPVERMWSQITVTALSQTGATDVLSDVEGVRRFMLLKQVQSRSRPTRILQTWKAAFGAERVATFFFEDVVRDPERVRAEVLGLLGADAERGREAVPADFNRKSAHPRLDMTPEARALLIEELRDELDACAEVFGSRGQAWRAKHLAA